MEKYVVEMLVNGEWKVWARYEEGCMGYSAKESRIRVENR